VNGLYTGTNKPLQFFFNFCFKQRHLSPATNFIVFAVMESMSSSSLPAADNVVELRKQLDELTEQNRALQTENCSLQALVTAGGIREQAMLAMHEQATEIFARQVGVQYQQSEQARIAAAASRDIAVSTLQRVEQAHVVVIAAKEDAITHLQLERQTMINTIEDRDARIAQLEGGDGGGGASQSAEVAALKDRLKFAENAAKVNGKLALEFQAEADAAYARIQVPGNGDAAPAGTFNRMVSIVNAAASVMNSGGGKNDWDRAGCEALVRAMVETLVSATTARRATVVNGMVVQVIWLRYVLCCLRYILI